jgi:hypothetical protein
MKLPESETRRNYSKIRQELVESNFRNQNELKQLLEVCSELIKCK